MKSPQCAIENASHLGPVKQEQEQLKVVRGACWEDVVIGLGGGGLPFPGPHKETGQLVPGTGAGADGRGSPVPRPELDGLRARPAVCDWSPGFFHTPGRELSSVGLTRT